MACQQEVAEEIERRQEAAHWTGAEMVLVGDPVSGVLGVRRYTLPASVA